MQTLPFSDWIDQIENFPVIVVPNQRLIRIFQQQLKQKASQRVFISPLILTPWQWLHRCAEESFLSGKIAAEQWPKRILTKIQASAIWHQVIPAEFPRSVIQHAISARQLCSEWAIEVDYPTVEFEHFSAWQRHFIERCAKQHCCDEAHWHTQLFEWLREGVFNLPESIIWAEFDALPPITLAIQTAISQQHISQTKLSFGYENAAAEIVVPCVNAEHELQSAAHWCNKMLAKNPHASLAVVIPDLSQRRQHIQTVFDKITQPDRIVSFDVEAPRQFNISAAPKLNEYLIIKTALIILQCSDLTKNIEFIDLSELLRSPYLGNWLNFQEHAKLEAKLRSKLKSEFSLSELLSALAGNKTPITNALMAWHQFAQLQVNARKTFADWSSVFLNLLNTLNWPGSRGLSSHEYQVVQRFQQSFSELAALSTINPRVNYAEALNWFRRILTDISFQPKTEAEPRIQILGVLEALGQRFDAIWICGLQDTAWPSAAKPHPLIPIAAQKKVNAPHSSAQRELDYARETLTHLKQHTPVFIASYPQWLEDQALHPSRLLTGNINSALAYHATHNFKPGQLNAIEDNNAPAISNQEITGIKGGTAIIEAQSRCPLWAFIEFRLHTRALEEPERYIGARDRGSLLHSTLEQVWRELGTQEKLNSLTPHEREKLIIHSANTAITRSKLKLDPVQKNIEINRLVKYLLNWLALESEREAFSIKALEFELQETLAGLPLTIRIDRIDSVEPNLSVILDYKSSAKRKLNTWLDDRITEIQLPLYACFLAADAISFALIAAKPVFNGISAVKELIPGTEPVENFISDYNATHETKILNWAELKQFWKIQLTGFATEFMSGEAANRFHHEDILFCPITPLLRPAERVQQWLNCVDQPEQ